MTEVDDFFIGGVQVSSPELRVNIYQLMQYAGVCLCVRACMLCVCRKEGIRFQSICNLNCIQLKETAGCC